MSETIEMLDTTNPTLQAETVAMVYRNEYKEVSHVTPVKASVGDAGLSSILLVFVLSMLALVTISRRTVGQD